jgi:glycosyltransferase involved in cell wall biosynthesis
MKKVLIISYFFPPYPAIGSQRPYGLAKYLPRFDWEPTILTVKHAGTSPHGIKVIATDCSDRIASIKKMYRFNSDAGVHEQLGIPITKNFDYSTWKSKIIKFSKEVLAYPDPQIGWYMHAVKAASAAFDKERFDAIISTSSPVTAHLAARTLKMRYNVPWVADFRDLWTQNHYYDKFKAIGFFERRLELRTLSDADALVTVSVPLADDLRRLHKKKAVSCITNGYDPDDFMQESSRLTDKFTITYTGQLYNGIRDPSMLFEVILKLIKEDRIKEELIEIRFFGRHEEWLVDEVKKYGLENVVNIFGFVSREDAMKRQAETQLLLLLLWNNKRERGVYTGKLFEYLGSKRPIVAIGGGESIIKGFLRETNAGRYAEDKDELEAALLHYYREFIEFGEARCASSENAGNYTYDSIAKRYSELLNNTCSSGRL